MNSFELVEASAGSGKTRALVVRYLSLLFLGQSPNKILALTFTNKAVQEMKNRIVNVICNLDSHMDYVEQISKITSLSPSDILNQKEQVLNDFLNQPSHIVTFDKFFNRILRLFCFYDDVSIDFGIKENMNSIKFLNYFLDNLEDSQMQNLINMSTFLDIDISDVLDLLFVLFSKDDDISGFIDTTQIIDSDIDKKIFNKIDLLEKLVHANPQSSTSALNTFKKITNVEDILNTTWITKTSLYESRNFKKIYTQDMDDIFLDLKTLLLQYCHQKQNIFLSKLLGVYSVFKSVKKKYQKFHNELSFSDIVNMVHSILKNNINTDFLYFRLDSKISHILVDELQDTSLREYRILQPLIEEILSGHSDRSLRTIFFVGDKKQSIFSFKGAKKELIEKISSNSQITTSKLRTNFRSSISVVKLTNNLFCSLYLDYEIQECYSKNIGYTQVSKVDKDDIKNTLINSIKQILNNGYSSDDIAILGFKNKDLLIINDWIQEELPDIQTVTDVSSKLVRHPRIRAIISLVNYLYFGDEVYLHNFSYITSYEDIDSIAIESKIIYEKYQTSNTDIHSLVLNIVKKYNLYDENVIVFLEKVSGFRDIIDFVYNIEDMEGKIVSSSLSGIRLITIHKSKGLEFKNVILVDQIGGDFRGSSKLLFAYDGTILENTYLRIKNREFVDLQYKYAIEEDKKSSRQDLINVLYVAITRAENNIFIIQKDAKSKFDILGLKEDSTGSFEKAEKKNIIVQDVKKCDTSIKLQNYGLQQDFLHKENNSVEKDINVESMRNIEYGKAMHYMLECLYELDKSSIDIAFFLTQNKYGFNIGDEALSSIKDTVLASLENNQFLELINNKIIKKELSFKYKQQIGIIDLLLEDDENLYIIDYKTSSSSSMSEYIEQIAFYKQAMKYLYKKPTIGYLFFLGEQKIIKVN